MYRKLLDALDGMHPRSGDGSAPPPDRRGASPYVEDLDLFVTTTDIRGEVVALKLADKSRDRTAVQRVLDKVRGMGTLDERLVPIVRALLTDEALLAHLATDYEVDLDIEPKTALRLLSRASRITSKVLDRIAAARNRKAPAMTWLARVGALLGALVEVAIPGSFRGLVFTRLLALVYVLEGLLVAAWVLLRPPGLARFVWTLVGLTVGVHVAVLVLGDVMRGRHRILKVVKYLLVAAVVLLALVGLDRVLGRGWVDGAVGFIKGLWSGPPALLR